MEEKKKKKRKGFGVFEILILAVAFGVLGYSLWNLLSIRRNYDVARDEYENLAESFVSVSEPETVSEPAAEGTDSRSETKEKSKKVRIKKTDSEAATSEATATETVYAPFSVNWAGLKAVNHEIVGWIHMDALPQIHYPICKGADNDYYLTHTFRREVNPSGAIFMDKNNAGDFSDALTFVYGHRMDDHSMFGDLKNLENQAVLDAHPYFWLYTPEGVFCYQIFSVFEESAASEVFEYHFENDEGFLSWAEDVRARSVVDTRTGISRTDKVLVLATCTTDRVRRVLVYGKCISVDVPGGVPEMEEEPEEAASSDKSGMW